MGKHSGTLVALLTIVAGLLAVGLVVLFDQVEHLAVFVLVVVLFLLGAVPIAMRLWRREFDLFESFVPYWVMNFLYYGAGALFVLFVDGVASDPGVVDFLDLAALYCTLGYACAVLGYYLTGRLVPPRRESLGANPGWILIAILYLLGWSGEMTFAVLERAPTTLFSTISSFTSLVSQLSFLSTFCIFYVLYRVLSKNAGIGFFAVLFVLMVPTQLLGLFLRIGNKTALFAVIGIPIIANWYARRRIAWKSILVTTLISVFFVFPLYYTVRDFKSVYYSQNYRIERTIHSMTRQQAGDFAESALRVTAKRLALINSTAVIVRECGRRVEYQMGGTLWTGVVSALIPRFLWPNKPKTTIGIQIARTFHITSFGSYAAISPSQAGELYWNFHVPGIVLGMFLIGVWLRCLYLRFGANLGSDPVRLAIYVTLLYSTLVSSDGTIGILEGRLIKEAFILVALEKGFVIFQSIGQRRAAAPAPGSPALAAR